MCVENVPYSFALCSLLKICIKLLKLIAEESVLQVVFMLIAKDHSCILKLCSLLKISLTILNPRRAS